MPWIDGTRWRPAVVGGSTLSLLGALPLRWGADNAPAMHLLAAFGLAGGPMLGVLVAYRPALTRPAAPVGAAIGPRILGRRGYAVAASAVGAAAITIANVSPKPGGYLLAILAAVTLALYLEAQCRARLSSTPRAERLQSQGLLALTPGAMPATFVVAAGLAVAFGAVGRYWDAIVATGGVGAVGAYWVLLGPLVRLAADRSPAALITWAVAVVAVAYLYAMHFAGRDLSQSVLAGIALPVLLLIGWLERTRRAVLAPKAATPLSPLARDNDPS